MILFCYAFSWPYIAVDFVYSIAKIIAIFDGAPRRVIHTEVVIHGQFPGFRIESGVTYHGAVTVRVDYVFTAMPIMKIIIFRPRATVPQNFREAL